MEPGGGFRLDINGLRALAVALVLLFHFNVAPFAGGYVGVDVFFVISGYLMTSLAMRDDGILLFWRRRAARIVPALVAMIAAVFAFASIMIEPITYVELAQEAISALLFLSNIYYSFNSGYFASSADLRWLLHTWSLSVEWQFYLVYPVLISLILKWRSSAVQAILWFGLLASFGLCVFVSGVRPEFAFYMLPTRAWEMIAGGLVLLNERRIRVRAALAWQSIGIGLIVAGAILFGRFTAWPSWNALLPVAGTVAILIASDARLWKSVPVQALGRWSYSVYLWHWPVVSWLRYLGWADSAAAIVTGLMVSIGLGWASFRFIELPAKTMFMRPRRPLAVAGLCTGAAICMAATAYPIDRRPQSNSPQLAEAAAASKDRGTEVDCTEAGFPNGARVCGKPRPGATLIIGDSHAGQWIDRYERQIRAGSVVFAMRHGCPWLPGTESAQGGKDCDGVYRAFMKFALDAPFQRVVFIAYWSASFDLKSPARACIIDSLTCSQPTSFEGYRPALDAFATDVRRLQLAGKSVSIVLTQPVPGINQPREVSKAIFAGRSVNKLRTIPRTEGSPIHAALAKVGADEVIDPQQHICTSTKCPAMNGDAPLYSDTDHFRRSTILNLDYLDTVIGVR